MVIVGLFTCIILLFTFTKEAIVYPPDRAEMLLCLLRPLVPGLAEAKTGMYGILFSRYTKVNILAIKLLKYLSTFLVDAEKKVQARYDRCIILYCVSNIIIGISFGRMVTSFVQSAKHQRILFAQYIPSQDQKFCALHPIHAGDGMGFTAHYIKSLRKLGSIDPAFSGRKGVII